MMNEYDYEQLGELCDNFDLVGYVSQFCELKGRGPEYSTSCLRHKDINPSLFLNSENNRWYCHSCHTKGTILQWLMYQEGLSYKEAINKLQDLTGKEIREVVPTTSMKIFKEMQSLNHEEEPVVREILPESYLDQFEIIEGEPHEWIEEGISPEMIKKYDIRIDPKGNRIVYGVYDANGNLIGAKGRTRFASYQLLGIKKYKNYLKVGTTDYLQGMKQNLPNIKAKKSMIVVEGLKSVMKIDQWGYDTGVATETSYLNDAQAKIIIASGCNEVTFAFDQDVTYANALKSANKVKKWTNCYIILDKNGLLKPKDSPCDEGREVWEQLYRERIRII